MSALLLPDVLVSAHTQLWGHPPSPEVPVPPQRWCRKHHLTGGWGASGSFRGLFCPGATSLQDAAGNGVRSLAQRLVFQVVSGGTDAQTVTKGALVVRTVTP